MHYYLESWVGYYALEDQFSQGEAAVKPADFRPNVLPKCHLSGSGAGVVRPSRARGPASGLLKQGEYR